MNFTGKTILVTGAGSGIGEATARAFAQTKGRVILTDINEEAGKKVVQAGNANEDLRFMAMDVTDYQQVQETAQHIRDELGCIDVLVNAAGWDLVEPFMQNTAEFWEKVIRINYLGQVQVTRAFLPLLIESQSGRIVNVASDAGRVGSSGETVYAGAKGGVIAFSKSLAREVVSKQVRVNVVCPGPTDTALFATLPEKLREGLKRAIPMKRLAQPSEVADAIVFLASDRASFITGQTLSVSGGLTMA